MPRVFLLLGGCSGGWCGLPRRDGRPWIVEAGEPSQDVVAETASGERWSFCSAGVASAEMLQFRDGWWGEAQGFLVPGRACGMAAVDDGCDASGCGDDVLRGKTTT